MDRRMTGLYFHSVTHCWTMMSIWEVIFLNRVCKGGVRATNEEMVGQLHKVLWFLQRKNTCSAACEVQSMHVSRAVFFTTVKHSETKFLSLVKPRIISWSALLSKFEWSLQCCCYTSKVECYPSEPWSKQVSLIHPSLIVLKSKSFQLKLLFHLVII